MARDTHADLHQLLTPREREVLELLRLGLTNGQIAERLDISPAGARYHVSEIIGKLGVRNRYEAAAWPERPPWWLAAASPVVLLWREAKVLATAKLNSAALIASGGLIAAALAGVGLVAFLLLRTGDDGIGLQAAACPSAAPPAAIDDVGELTPEQLTDRVAAALTCPGYVLHLRSTGDFEAGPYSSYSETDAWIDLERNLGRIDSRVIFNSEAARQAAEEEGEELPEFREVTIVRGDGEYTGERGPEVPARKQRPPDCHGPDRTALALILPCEGPTEELEVTVERNVAYQGRNAIAYVATGTSRGSDETYHTTARAYLDRDTLLPLGVTVDGTLDIGDVYPVYSDLAYQAQFVPLDSLPPDFFDPASIGYVEVDPEEPLETQDFGVTVYWLGRGFEGGDSLPALALLHVTTVPSSPFSPTVEILYRRADDEFGSGIVVLEVYKPEIWEARPISSRTRCVQTRDLALSGRQATIYSGYDELRIASGASCPPPDKFTAVVFIDNTVVEIRAPTVVTGSQTFQSPYNSQAAMELLIRSLFARE